MKVTRKGAGWYEAEYKGFLFDINKQWVSGDWVVSQAYDTPEEDWFNVTTTRYSYCKEYIKQHVNQLKSES